MSNKRAARAPIAALAALALALGVAACGSSDDDTHRRRPRRRRRRQAINSNPANGKVSLTIGSKNFTEQIILGEIYAQALEAAGYKVKKDLNLGSETVALQALKAGEISGYPEYASTALTSFFGVEPEEGPGQRRRRPTQKANAEFEEGGPGGLPADPVRQRQRRRDAEDDGRQARPEDDLRPRRASRRT